MGSREVTTRSAFARCLSLCLTLAGLLFVVSSPVLSQSEPTINYRSIGINPNVLFQSGSATVEAGSATVSIDAGTPLPSHIGIGDRLVLDPGGDAEETLFLLSRDGDTQVTVQTPAVYSHPGADFTITRAFNRIQAWEKARQGELVADGRREVGVCYKDGPFVGFGAYALATIDGSTTDADHYMHLTVAPGHRHTGTAGTGVVLDGENTTKIGIRPRDDYVRIDGLEFTRFRSEHGATAIEVGTPSSSKTVERRAHGVLLEDLLIYNFDHEAWSVVGIKGSRASDFTVRNTIIWDGDTAGIRINRQGGPQTSFTAWESSLAKIGHGKQVYDAPIPGKRKMNHRLSQLVFSIIGLHTIRLVDNVHQMNEFSRPPEHFSKANAKFPGVTKPQIV